MASSIAAQFRWHIKKDSGTISVAHFAFVDPSLLEPFVLVATVPLRMPTGHCFLLEDENLYESRHVLVSYDRTALPHAWYLAQPRHMATIAACAHSCSSNVVRPIALLFSSN